MSSDFDINEAREFLSKKEAQKNEEYEQERLKVLQRVTELLKKEFSDSEVEVYLVGSITKPHQFTKRSDVDIVIKNFKGDRFDTWPKLERKIGRDVELILYENCHFKDHVKSQGLRIV